MGNTDGMGISPIWICVVAGLSWVIVMMGIAQLSRFYAKFQEARRDLDANMRTLVDQLKKMQATLAELLVEQRRISKLTNEQIDLKRAELTGDFEIVEEPIQKTPNEAEKSGSATPQGKRAPSKFPDIG